MRFACGDDKRRPMIGCLRSVCVFSHQGVQGEFLGFLETVSTSGLLSCVSHLFLVFEDFEPVEIK